MPHLHINTLFHFSVLWSEEDDFCPQNNEIIREQLSQTSLQKDSKLSMILTQDRGILLKERV